jgi:hypothetical protein
MKFIMQIPLSPVISSFLNQHSVQRTSGLRCEKPTYVLHRLTTSLSHPINNKLPSIVLKENRGALKLVMT